jgi:hypothetical protein
MQHGTFDCRQTRALSVGDNLREVSIVASILGFGMRIGGPELGSASCHLDYGLVLVTSHAQPVYRSRYLLLYSLLLAT